ncbi:NRDE family protein [Natronobacterium gregoryi]|uniref:NRDE family protein n=2 Tax=Natronobacterium gregoryi TaxID=44930 RepID=L0AEI7_NATGS|nr:NRDE family protein [Natronobacterium gregoryi]AFZ71475.1 hypothetical protein Natgr_0214 [Natronobacterium gregoryi SP2]ELY66777.1 hypothetical protein C490_12210 [Natronobacterium gregoryi SP2]PLK19932.1 hypothetical protein CYV19_12030 [Natronobacterium gregoryi SP2]SFJ36560.1 Uncharacterized conserved protein, contains NRDE domain [Natronobacterium gregoryi]
MCTLTLAWQVFDDAPVAVAANRDERLERDSISPDVYSEEPRVVAPQDAEAGGTWIGYNEFGVFAGITNRWIDHELAGDRSRGLLVADVLKARSAAEAAALVEDTTAADEYDGFHLVIADAENAYCYQWDGDLEITEFDPGVHVVVNVAVDDDADVPSARADAARAQAENGREIRKELSVLTDERGEPTETVTAWLERAGDVLGDHEYGVCLHENGFGTRSSSLIAIGPEQSPPAARYSFAAGPPCQTEYDRLEVSLSEPETETDTTSEVDDERHI